MKECQNVYLLTHLFPHIHVVIDSSIKQRIKDKVHNAFCKGPKFLGQEQIGTKLVTVTKTRPVYSTRQVPIYGNGNEFVQMTQQVGSYNSFITVYNNSSYTINVNTNGNIGSATIAPKGIFTDNHCTMCTVYLNGQVLLSGTSGTKYLNTVIVGYRTETYQSGTETYTEYVEQPVYEDRMGLEMGIRRKL